MIYRLNGVSEEEAKEVRALLDAEQVDYYETPGGNWGVSVAGIWLRDESALEEVQKLLQDYGEQRALRVRTVPVPSFMERLREAPVTTLFYLLAALAILYLSLLPFMGR